MCSWVIKKGFIISKYIVSPSALNTKPYGPERFIELTCFDLATVTTRLRYGTVRYSTVAVRYSTVAVRHSTVAVRYSTVAVRNSTVEVRYSTVAVRNSTVAVRYSGCGQSVLFLVERQKMKG